MAKNQVYEGLVPPGFWHSGHRCTIGQDRARPLLDALRIWMEKTLRSLSTKSKAAGAIRYALPVSDIT